MPAEHPSKRESPRGPDIATGGGERCTPSPPEEDAPESAVGATSGIPVVGLGGSAGALESFHRFFAVMPADSGAAFVVIQHLAPTHQSLLPELLAQHTRMRVVQAEDGVPVEPNTVYVIPPNAYLGIRDGVLSLTEPGSPDRIRMAIDVFFRALAADRQERAVGILFSGAGADGTLGVRAIRGAGGLTLAQDPQTAQFGEMSRSAIATGLVDAILPPDRMPEALVPYLRQPYVRGGEPSAVLEAEGTPGGFPDILATVRAQTGCDFQSYKKSTTLRRIQRRMGMRGLSNLAQYDGLLHQDAEEVRQLLQDLLINVTTFFRDPAAFEELLQLALRPLLSARQTADPVRVWVAGCSSGEEAYSLAMLLAEEVGAADPSRAFQVFATDLDEEALHVARVGLYPESIVADVGKDRLARFFVRTEQGCQVDASLRQAVVFATHNVLTDPPFSRLDLISCRNLLIYLDADTQTRLMPLFHFALNPDSYLFLGTSEGVASQHDLFAPVSKKARLYRRLTPARPVVPESPFLQARPRTLPAAGLAVGPPASAVFGDLIRQALLRHLAASVVLVDRHGRILQFHGQTGKYLDMPTAEPTLNLLAIAKEGLSARLRSAIRTALTGGQPVVLDGVPITREAGAPCVRITVDPRIPRGGTDPLLAVLFEDVSRPVAAGGALASGESEPVVQRLEEELRETRLDLQGRTEELQASTEALRLANEELMSTNEELQSTIEELETSKEELQSTNEELTTVNSQLQEKLERLDAANSDLANLLTATEIATLFLDGEQRIRFYSPATTQLLRLLPSDTGRPIDDLAMPFRDFDLPADARAVARGGSVVEREVHRIDGASYLVRVMPYRSPKGSRDGAVVTFTDVSRLRRAETLARRLATVVRDSNDAVILCDLTGTILAWNRGAQGMYGWSEPDVVGMNLSDLMPPDRLAEFANLMQRALAGEPIASFESQRRTKDGRVLEVWVTATAVWNDSTQRIEGLATTERDITERKHAAAELRQHRHDLEELVRKRTSQLEAANAQLRALASELTLAEQRERERVATVLHDDLQQLLVGMKLLVSPLAQATDPKVQELCREVDDLINRCLQCSRSLTEELSPPILHRGGLVPALGWLVQWMAEKYHLTVVVRSDASAVVDSPDTTVLLFQAIRELLFNAVKYAQVQTAQVEITRQDDQVQVVVSDAGVGFDPAPLRVAGGTSGGFGLFSLHERLKLLGGGLKVESTLGTGSRFTFWLPLQHTPATAPPVPGHLEPPECAASSAGVHPAPGRTGRIRVLVVDDHEVVRQGLTRLLSAEPDMEIVGEAAEGGEAVELTPRLAPDVILMDVSMPGMNGIEATRLIRARYPTVRVIGLSMFEEAERAQAMRDAGAVGYLTKSGASEALVTAIRGSVAQA